MWWVIAGGVFAAWLGFGWLAAWAADDDVTQPWVVMGVEHETHPPGNS